MSFEIFYIYDIFIRLMMSQDKSMCKIYWRKKQYSFVSFRSSLRENSVSANDNINVKHISIQQPKENKMLTVIFLWNQRLVNFRKNASPAPSLELIFWSIFKTNPCQLGTKKILKTIEWANLCWFVWKIPGKFISPS